MLKLPAKIRTWRWSLVLIAFHVTTTAQAGPIFLTRGVLQHPRYPVTQDSTQFLPHLGLWGGIQRGFESEGGRFAWMLSTGAVLEFVRWTNGGSLIGISGMELTADPHNEISFNPTGIVWEEYLLYAQRGSTLDWQAGFVQRCRHDIDNLDIKVSTGEAQQRTLIYSSLHGKLITHPFDIGASGELQTWLRGDVYVIRQDYRLPHSTDTASPNFEDLAYSIGWSFHTDLMKFGFGNLYLKGDLTATGFGRGDGFSKRYLELDRTTLDLRFEAGLSLRGAAGDLLIYAGYEHFDDDGTQPVPRSNSLAFVGFRVRDINLAL